MSSEIEVLGLQQSNHYDGELTKNVGKAATFPAPKRKKALLELR